MGFDPVSANVAAAMARPKTLLDVRDEPLSREQLPHRDMTPRTFFMRHGDFSYQSVGSGGQQLLIALADVPCVIKSVSMCCFGADVTNDVSNLWNFTVQHYRGTAQGRDVATKGTSVTPLSRRVARHFHEFDWDADADAYLYRNDTLGMKLAFTGTPQPLVDFHTYVVLEPLGSDS